MLIEDGWYYLGILCYFSDKKSSIDENKLDVEAIQKNSMKIRLLDSVHLNWNCIFRVNLMLSRTFGSVGVFFG